MQYISALFGVITLAGAKCALNLVIMAVNDLGLMYYASRTHITLILLVAVSSLVASVFRCPLPTPWLPRLSCPAAAAIVKYSIWSNIVTDVDLCMLSVAMVWILKDRWTKILVVALFTTRIL